MQWHDELLIGINEIDEQHKAVAESISGLRRALRGNQGWSDVHVAVSRLVDTVRMHFSVEESLMRIHDYPRLPDHQDEHRGYLTRLEGLRELSLKSKLQADALDQLAEWWRNHIRHNDKDYAFHFLRNMTSRLAASHDPSHSVSAEHSHN